jgi:hypothetical protein
MPMQLYEANHLYLMKIALITKNLQEKKHHLNISSIRKTTYHIKSEKKVPNFAARWRAICIYFITSDNTKSRRTGKIIKTQGDSPKFRR